MVAFETSVRQTFQKVKQDVVSKLSKSSTLSAVTDVLFSSKVTADPVDRFVARSDGKLEWGDGAVARDVTLERITQDNGSIALSTLARLVVGSVRFKADPNAITIFDVPGTNGRRLSIQPNDQLNSTASSQIEIVPGANVTPAEVTTQILFMHKPGSDYERFVISTFNNEYQFHASRAGTGVTRSTFFYADNEPITAWMADLSFRVYKNLDFFDKTANALWGTIKAYAAGHIGTAQSFRVKEGSTSQIRLGDPSALALPTISFGTDGTVNVHRNGANLKLTGANWTPTATASLDLGVDALRWRDLFLSRYLRLGTLYLRDNTGVLEKSTDGTAWTPVDTGGGSLPDVDFLADYNTAYAAA